MSRKNWFGKQYRTKIDAFLDEIDPHRIVPPPIEPDSDGEVAPATSGVHAMDASCVLKGTYWFIRKRYRKEVKRAIRRNKPSRSQK